ncbi:MAG: DUF305 domain-containing protein [Blastocatellia bacterium]|nr:MAG: DUF305 domain-containing protein [Blastocatellia bacterium]
MNSSNIEQGREMNMRRTFMVASLVSAFFYACTNDEMNNSNVTGNVNSNANTRSVAQTSPATTVTPGRGVVTPRSDQDFVNEAAQGGMAEVELGRLAAQKGLSPDVKRFGQRMVTDHSNANTELKQLATRKAITLPTTVSTEQKDELTKLSKLSGAEFDREYMSLMVEDHDKDVAAFQSQAQGASDADIKAWAAKTLPVLKEHQNMAHEINVKLK